MRCAWPSSGRSAARRSTTARSSSWRRTTARLRIEVGYGLEGALNDATASRIIREVIVPRFREGDFFGGISAGLERMMRVIDGEPLPEAARPAPRVDGGAAADAAGAAHPRARRGRRSCAAFSGASSARSPPAARSARSPGCSWARSPSGCSRASSHSSSRSLGAGRGGGYYGGFPGGFGGYLRRRFGGGGFGGGFRGGGGTFGGGGASGRW